MGFENELNNNYLTRRECREIFQFYVIIPVFHIDYHYFWITPRNADGDELWCPEKYADDLIKIKVCFYKFKYADNSSMQRLARKEAKILLLSLRSSVQMNVNKMCK